MRLPSAATSAGACLALVLVLALATGATAQTPLVHFSEQPFGDAFLADGTGRDVAALGDVDGDGRGDFAVGLPLADTIAGVAAGRVVAFSGADRSVLWTAEGGAPSDNLGLALAAAGDVDADGIGDVIAGAPHGPLPIEGYARVLSGDDGAVLLTLDLDPSLGSQHFGEYVAGGADFDGDAHADLVVLQVGGAGRVHLFSGSDGALLQSYGAAFLFGLGFVATAGDLDADGVDDFMYRWQGEGGGTLLVRSGDDGQLLQELLVSAARDVGDRDGDDVTDLLLSDGRLVSGATWATLLDLPGSGDPHGLGDVDGDGKPDLALGPVVYSGNDGSKLFTAAHALSLIDLGDANGDGLRDLVGRSVAQASEAHSPAALLMHRPAWAVDMAFGAQEGADSGRQVAILGDVNADGYDDVLVAAPFDDTAGAFPGSVTLLSGADGSALLTLTGFAPFTEFGTAAAPAGDVDGDGTPDLVVGSPIEAITGVVRVFSGDDGSVIFTATGTTPFGLFGAAVAAAGDVDHDGYSDVVVGEPDASSLAGGVWLLAGPDGAPRFHAIASPTLTGLGTSVAAAGDVNGDGVGDVAAGAPGVGSSGSVQWLSGVDGSLIGSALGLPTERDFGARLAAIGDVSGDGIADLAVAARWRELQISQFDRDRVVVLSGADASRHFTWTFAPGPQSGSPAVGAAGDVDDDGVPDVALGTRGNDIPRSVEVRAGATGATLLSFAGAADEELGASVGGGGDVNGDGLNDVVIGIPGADDAGVDAGLARVVGFAPVLPPWTFLGKGLAGAQGLPVLLAAGELLPDGAVTMSLTGAEAHSRNALVVGLRALHLPFKGGTLVPAPDAVLWLPLTDATGAWELVAHWPTGLPAATPLWFQAWVIDPSGPQGLAASNALLGVTPP